MNRYRKVEVNMGVDDDSWEHFIEDAEKLLGELDDLPERAEDFADGVRECLEGMVEWARENEHVTEKMWNALYRTQDGVAKWQR
jgi:hypothetical protein